MRFTSRGNRRASQRGLTMFGLLFWGMLVGFTGYLAVVILPTLNEYFTIQRAVDKVAGGSPATVGEARIAFDKQRDIEYSIESVTGKDLEITKENEKVVIKFAYNKEVPIYGAVYVLIKYAGRSR